MWNKEKGDPRDQIKSAIRKLQKGIAWFNGVAIQNDNLYFYDGTTLGAKMGWTTAGSWLQLLSETSKNYYIATDGIIQLASANAILLSGGAISVATGINKNITFTTTGTGKVIGATKISETEVFTGTSPAAWTDLDLSGTVGANSAIVFLKILTSQAKDVAVRKNGDTDEFYSATGTARAMGCATATCNAYTHIVLICATDSAGVIEWKVGGEVTTTVDIVAYIC